jgi:hypothetical protein
MLIWFGWQGRQGVPGLNDSNSIEGAGAPPSRPFYPAIELMEHVLERLDALENEVKDLKAKCQDLSDDIYKLENNGEPREY